MKVKATTVNAVKAVLGAAGIVAEGNAAAYLHRDKLFRCRRFRTAALYVKDFPV
jgi:hypothetical protein